MQHSRLKILKKMQQYGDGEIDEGEKGFEIKYSEEDH